MQTSLPLNYHRVHWGSVGLYPGQSVPPRVTILINSIPGDIPQRSSNHNSPKQYEAPQPHGLMHIGGTTHETVPQPCPDMAGINLLTKPSLSGHCTHGTFTGSSLWISGWILSVFVQVFPSSALNCQNASNTALAVLSLHSPCGQFSYIYASGHSRLAGMMDKPVRDILFNLPSPLVMIMSENSNTVWGACSAQFTTQDHWAFSKKAFAHQCVGIKSHPIWLSDSSSLIYKGGWFRWQWTIHPLCVT